MKILGYVLIVVGILDIGSSFILPNGSPVDLIVGPTVGQFTGYVFLGIGYFLTSSSSNSEKEESN